MLLTQTLRSIPYLFNNSQTAAFSVLSNLWNVTYIPQTHHSCYPPDDVFIQAFCSLQRVRNETERRHIKKIIDLYRHTYSRQASIAFLIQTLKHVLICHLCLIPPPPPSCYWLFQCVVSGRKISYCNLKRPLDNLLTSSVAVYLCMKMKQWKQNIKINK